MQFDVTSRRDNYDRSKRLFDATASVVGLLLLGPLILLLVPIVAAVMGRPIFFRQVRPGLHGRPFEMIKFRTMTNARNAAGELLSDRERLTAFGAWLRRTSLDELPELLNVLKGEMSLVGPRPLLMEYLPLFTPAQARRHEVPPGITGWAQVNGRNDIEWEDKLALDVWYVDNRSLSVDLHILWLTLVKVIRSEGVNRSGHATTSKFTGSKQ